MRDAGDERLQAARDRVDDELARLLAGEDSGGEEVPPELAPPASSPRASSPGPSSRAGTARTPSAGGGSFGSQAEARSSGTSIPLREASGRKTPVDTSLKTLISSRSGAAKLSRPYSRALESPSVAWPPSNLRVLMGTPYFAHQDKSVALPEWVPMGAPACVACPDSPSSF